MPVNLVLIKRKVCIDRYIYLIHSDLGFPIYLVSEGLIFLLLYLEMYHMA